MFINEDDIVIAGPVGGVDTFQGWHRDRESGLSTLRLDFFATCMASALGKALVTLHDANLNHALKEVDAAALATCATPEQVVETLAYVIRGEMPGRKDGLAAE